MLHTVAMKVSKPLSKFNVGDPVYVSVYLGGLEQELAGFVTVVKYHDILREFFYSVKFFENEVFLEHFLKGDVDYRLGGLDEYLITKIEKRYE
jgi:hypothetical protein